MHEEWRRVVGNDSYEVSSLGNVRRAVAGDSNFAKAGRHLRPSRNTRYSIVVLYSQHKGRAVKVHRLVAAAFIGPCPEGHEVNHINGERHDNRAENLEYVTPRQNVRHTFRALRHGSARLSPNLAAYIRSSPLRGAELARQLKVSPATISETRSGQIWTND